MPLLAWKCDQCEEMIANPGDGIVVWRSNDDVQYFDFKIVHRKIRSGSETHGCDPGNAQGYYHSMYLDEF